jgi:hypothetical protein
MIWWTSRTDRVGSDPDSSAKAPMRLASRKSKVSPLSCLQMSVWVVIQKPDRISQSGLGTCQRLPRLYVGIAAERTQQPHARIRSFSDGIYEEQRWSARPCRSRHYVIFFRAGLTWMTIARACGPGRHTHETTTCRAAHASKNTETTWLARA